MRDAVKKAGFAVPRHEGEENGEWIIVDCGQCVVHIMQPTIRQYYRLEEIWGDKPVRLKLGGAKPAKIFASEDASAAAKPAKKPAAKKSVAAVDGKTVVKKAAAKNSAAAKTAADKPAVKKPAAKKPAAKKTTALKTVVVKPTGTPWWCEEGCCQEGMKPLIVAVGQHVPDWAQTAYDDYAKRFPPELKVELKAVKTEPRGSKTVETLYAAERKRIEAAIPRGTRIVVLDERGTNLTTKALAARLQNWQLEGDDVALIIGGPDGLDPLSSNWRMKRFACRT